MKTRILLTTLALTLPLAGARAVILTTNATIAVGDTTYDSQDIVVSNSTLTVNGAHSFASLLLASNAVLTHAAAPNGETDNRVSLTIAGDVTVDVTSVINAAGLGYAANKGPGAGGQSSWGGEGGGGHGGNGGNGIPGAGGGAIYGSIPAPITHGSGGNYHAGSGGGVIRLAVGGTLTVDGVISASGNNAYDADGGGGSGGSVFLSTATLAGTGSIRADGGNGGSGSSGGGGGGRVALFADTLSFSGAISAVGGTGFQAGGAGTVFTRVTTESFGRLRLDNAGRSGYTRFDATNWPAGQVYALSLSGAVIVVPLIPFTVSQLDITTGAMLTHEHLCGQPLRINVLGSAVIGTNASINVDGAGYYNVAWYQNDRGPGVGGISGWNAAGGGGYGGAGGAGIPGGGQGATYGSYLEPVDFGSTSLANGSYGGGSVRLAVGGTLTVDGTISAGGQGGGAAGGSVYLACAELAGSGILQANGSGADTTSQGSGGGGRIAVHAGTMSFLGTNSVAGGTGGFGDGGIGTIYLTNSAALCGSVRNAAYQGIAGAMVSATGGYSTFTDAQGGFMLLVPSDWSGSASVTATNQILTPASCTLAHVSTPQFGIDFIAEALCRPVISSQNLGGSLRLSWDSQSGPSYQVYSATNLLNWSAYGPLQPGTGNPLTLDCPMTNSPGLFFRVQATGN